MKLFNLAIAASLVASAQAFTNSAPVLIKLEGGKSIDKLPYVTEFNDISSKVNKISEEICSAKESSPLIIYQISHLNRVSMLDLQKKQHFKIVSPHLHYQDKDINFKISSNCDASSIKTINVEDLSSFNIGDEISGDDKIINIIIQNKTPIESIISNLNSMSNIVKSIYNKELNLIIQGVPLFTSVKDRVARADSIINEEDFEELASEVEDDKISIESYLQDNEETESSESSYTQSEIVPARNNTISNPNLFTNYQFFTPGIWMGTIVSLFLVWVLLIALSWTGSLQISYKAFDKQVDFNKKTQ